MPMPSVFFTTRGRVAEVRWTRNALGYTLELGERERTRIENAVDSLGRFPLLGVALVGPYAGRRRLVVGRRTIVHSHDAAGDRVTVETIAYRLA